MLKDQFFSQKEEKKSNLQSSDKLKELLKNKAEPKAIIEFLKELSPSGIELEILSLSTFDLKEKVDYLELMLGILLQCTEDKNNFDFVQSILACFLKTHQELILGDSKMMEQLQRIQHATEMAFSEVEQSILQNQCMLAHFANI